jgi:Fe-S-cluster-containing hydrogenase component 2/bacterioferritin-associated ferredoxin
VVTEDIPEREDGVFPVLHCAQEIPCNPCTSVCPQGCITIGEEDIRGLPEYLGDECIGCEQCVAICPGLAITLVDYSTDADYATVTIPYEFPSETIGKGDTVTVLDTEGKVLGNVEVVKVRQPRFADRALLVRVRAPREIAKRIAGIRVQDPWVSEPLEETVGRISDDEIVCRCERVTAGEIVELIRAGVRDINYIKAVTRAGMGACGGKTCTNLIKRLFREEGVQLDAVKESTQRPLFIEVPLGVFAGVSDREKPVAEVPATHATDAHEGGM